MGIGVQPLCCDRFIMTTGGKQTKFTTTGGNARVRNYDSGSSQLFDVDGVNRLVYYERSVSGSFPICRRTLDGEELTVLISKPDTSSNGVCVSPSIDLMAYSTTATLETANLNGGDIQTILTLNPAVDRFTGRCLVIDEDNERLLFCRANPLSSPTQQGQIRFVSLGGGSSSTLVSASDFGGSNLRAFSHVVRHRATRRVFFVFSQFTTPAQIWACDDDGGNIAMIYEAPLANNNISSIHTTHYNERLWWYQTGGADTGLHRCDLGGGNHRIVLPINRIVQGVNGLIVGGGFTEPYNRYWGL